MAANYVLLERIELNASATSVTFSNIPQSGYTDLKVVVSARSTTWGYAYNNLYMTFNGAPTGSSYGDINLYAVGSSTGSFGHNAQNQPWTAATPSTDTTANTFGSIEIDIPNYRSSNYKAFLTNGVTETNSATNGQVFLNLQTGLWASTSAITSLVFTTDVTNFVAGSVFSLYGVADVNTTPAIAPKATGGNITTDGTYWIHTFNATDVFTPQTALSCDYLVVAGGGGGGSYGGRGGGGGGGGFRTGTGLSVSAQAYTITVGAGGAAGSSSVGTNGGNSIFSTITSSGGGGGGSGTSGSAPSGGSGGGGTSGNVNGVTNAGGSGNTPSTSPSQGNNGGYGTTTASIAYAGGGGGGAGATGGNASTSGETVAIGGNGGAGASNSYSGSSVTYAGGGGGGAYSTSTITGGTGGSGGGGNGLGATAGTAGTVNTGGGGGGQAYAGGSGIVIIRYAV